MKLAHTLKVLAVAGLALVLCACRGGTSEKPPVHIVLDMDFQQKLKTQAKAEFDGWTDGRAMRLPVAGTVARESLPDPKLLPDPRNPGKGTDGAYLKSNPLEATAANLARGRERYNINCAVCHGESGRGGNGPSGHGMVGKLWPVAVPNFHEKAGADNRVANLTDGEYFEVISKGKGTMPGYAARISLEDRWAIIHYVRALQALGKQP